jgi:hypothetical protein
MAVCGRGRVGSSPLRAAAADNGNRQRRPRPDMESRKRVVRPRPSHSRTHQQNSNDVRALPPALATSNWRASDPPRQHVRRVPVHLPAEVRSRQHQRARAHAVPARAAPPNSGARHPDENRLITGTLQICGEMLVWRYRGSNTAWSVGLSVTRCSICWTARCTTTMSTVPPPPPPPTHTPAPPVHSFPRAHAH